MSKQRTIGGTLAYLCCFQRFNYSSDNQKHLAYIFTHRQKNRLKISYTHCYSVSINYNKGSKTTYAREKSTVDIPLLPAATVTRK